MDTVLQKRYPSFYPVEQNYEKKSRQHVSHPKTFAEGKIDTDSKDQRISHKGKVCNDHIREKGFQKTGKQSNTALP